MSACQPCPHSVSPSPPSATCTWLAHYSAISWTNASWTNALPTACSCFTATLPAVCALLRLCSIMRDPSPADYINKSLPLDFPIQIDEDAATVTGECCGRSLLGGEVREWRCRFGCSAGLPASLGLGWQTVH